MPTKVKEQKEPKPPKQPKTPKEKKKPVHFCEIKYYLDYPPEERDKIFTVTFD